jgi:large subunit ribosomal protein L30
LKTVSERKSKKIRIKWVRSGIGFPYRQKDVVRSLGLRRLNHVVECEDTPQIRGLVAKAPHLVEIVEAGIEPTPAKLPEYTVVKPQVAEPEVVSQQEPENQVE